MATQDPVLREANVPAPAAALRSRHNKDDFFVDFQPAIDHFESKRRAAQVVAGAARAGLSWLLPLRCPPMAGTGPLDRTTEQRATLVQRPSALSLHPALLQEAAIAQARAAALAADRLTAAAAAGEASAVLLDKTTVDEWGGAGVSVEDEWDDAPLPATAAAAAEVRCGWGQGLGHSLSMQACTPNILPPHCHMRRLLTVVIAPALCRRRQLRPPRRSQRWRSRRRPAG